MLHVEKNLYKSCILIVIYIPAIAAVPGEGAANEQFEIESNG